MDKRKATIFTLKLNQKGKTMETKDKKVYNNVGSGILWKNKFKKSDREPFFRGKATIKGKEFEVAAWLKKDKNNQDMISMSFDDAVEAETPPHKRNGKKEKSIEDIFGGD